VGVYLTWEIEDDEGQNPLGEPGSFEFHLDCDVTPGDPGYLYNHNGDGYPGYAPAVEIVSVTCTRLATDADPSGRKPTEDEQNALSYWFYLWVDTHACDRESIEKQALEYACVAPDYDDVDD
jgi:hypothetical protein